MVACAQADDPTLRESPDELPQGVSHWAAFADGPSLRRV